MSILEIFLLVDGRHTARLILIHPYYLSKINGNNLYKIAVSTDVDVKKSVKILQLKVSDIITRLYHNCSYSTEYNSYCRCKIHIFLVVVEDRFIFYATKCIKLHQKLCRIILCGAREYNKRIFNKIWKIQQH